MRVKCKSAIKSAATKQQDQLIQQQQHQQHHDDDYGHSNVERNNSNHATTRHVVGCYGDYTITFQPGPIGMKLEPISVSSSSLQGRKEIGCRVLQFINLPSGEKGQAEQSGMISPGDVLIQINHTSVISWTYPDVIRYLKMLPPTQGKQLKFKSVGHDMAEDFWQQQQQQQPLSAKRRIVGFTNYENDGGNRGSFGPEKVLSNHILNNLPTSAQPSVQETSIFSPSKVKALSHERYTTTRHDTANDMSLESCETSSTTTRHSTKKPTAFASKLASQMTNRLARVLMTEHQTSSSQEHNNQAVQLKMQLLTELSHAKITIDAKVQEKGKLETMIRNLSSELDLTRNENASLQCQVTSWKEAKVNLEQLFEDALTKQDSAMEEQRKMYQMEKDELVHQAEDLSIQVAALKQGQIQADRDLQTVQTELQTKVNCAMEMEAKVLKLEQVVAHQQATIEAAHSELEASRHAHQNDKAIKDDLVTTATTHAAHLQTVVSKHEATIQSTQDALQEANATFETQMRIKQDLISSLTLQSTHLQGLVSNQNEIIEHKDRELDKLRVEFDAEMRVKDVLVLQTQTRVCQLEETVTELQTCLDQARQELTQALHQVAHEVANMDGLKSTFQDQTNAYERDLQRLESANTELVKSKNNLKVALEQTVCRLESTNKNQSRLEILVNEETQKRLHAREQLRIVKESYKACELTIAQLQSDKVIAENRLDEETNQRTHVQGQLRDSMALCEAHESTISLLQSDKAVADHRLEEEIIKLTDIEGQLQVVKELCETHESTISQLRSDKAVDESSLAEETTKLTNVECQLRVVEKLCATHNSTISQLESDNAIAENRLADESVKRTNVEGQLRVAEELCEKHESTISQLQSDKAIAEDRLAEENKKRTNVEGRLWALEALCEAHESTLSLLESDRDIADHRCKEETNKLAHAQGQLRIVQALCDAHESTISQLQSDKAIVENRFGEEAITRTCIEGQLQELQVLCEAQESTISQLQSEKAMAETCLEEEAIKRTHIDGQLRAVQALCDANELTISQLQSDKESAEIRLDELASELSKHHHTAEQLFNRQKVLDDFKILVEEQEKAFSASQDISATLKLNHTELLSDLATFQIILDTACMDTDSANDASTAPCSRALSSHHHTPCVESAISRTSLSSQTNDTVSVLDSEETKIIRAAAALGNLKRDGRVHDLHTDHTDENAILIDSPQHDSKEELSVRVSQLERFLHEALLENEELGAEARGLRCALDSATSQYNAELKELRTELTILRTGDQKQMAELQHIRQKQQEADAKASIRAKVIATLQSQVDNEVGNYRARQSEFVEDVERHVQYLEEEVRKAVEENKWLHCSLSEEKSKLTSADTMLARLREKSLMADKQLQVLAISLRDGFLARKDMSMRISEIQLEEGLNAKPLQETGPALEEEVVQEKTGKVQGDNCAQAWYRFQGDLARLQAQNDPISRARAEHGTPMSSLPKHDVSSPFQGINSPSDGMADDADQRLLAFDDGLSNGDNLQRSIDNLRIQLSQVLIHYGNTWSDLQSCHSRLEEQSKRTEELEALLKKRTDLEDLCQRQTCLVSSLQTSVQSERDQLRHKVDEVERLKDILSVTKQRVSDLQASLDVVRNQNREMSNALQCHVSEVDRLNTIIASNKVAATSLKLTMSTMESDQIAKDGHLREKDQEIESLKAVNDAVKQKISTLEDELSSVASVFENVRKENDEYRRDKDQSIERLKILNTEAKKNIAALEVELSIRTVEFQNQEREKDGRLRDTALEIERLKVINENTKSKMAALEAELDSRTSEFENQWRESDGRWREKDRAMEQLKIVNENAEQKVVFLEAELCSRTAEFENQWSETEGHLRDMEQEIKRLKDVNENAKQEVAILKAELSSRTLEFKNQESEKVGHLRDLEQEVERLKVINENTTHNLAFLEAELDSRTSEFENQKTEKDGRLRDLDLEIERLKIVNENIEHKVAVLEAELSSRTSEYDSSQRQLQAENTDLRECVQALEDEYHARVATIDDQKVEINKLCEALRFSEDEANHLADEIIRHRQCREQAENDRNALQSEVDWLHREMESQDEAAKFLQARVNELQGTVSLPSLEESHDDQQKRLTADTSALRASRRNTSGRTSPGLPIGDTLSEVTLRKSAAGLLIENILLNREKSELGRGFRQWSANTTAMGAVSHHVQVAEVMNRQLQTTWSKVSALKSHLKAQNGGGR